MLIYIEKSQINNPVAKNIIDSYRNPKILEIDNYKNLFDKKILGNTEKSIIIAWVNNAILEAPKWYWFSTKWYFLKNSLNCVYDCKYCYLKWAFKNDKLVVFVNYDEIKKQVLNLVGKITDKVWFYSSDYSDNLAIDNLTNFSLEFIPFFETLDNAMMEIRTKSINIKNLLKLKPAKNTEIAFSLNPSEVVKSYEKLTPSLEARIKAINTLIDLWWKVWVRFLPLLEIDNYKEVYTRFLDNIIEKIDFSKINSIFIWGLMFTHKDYSNILKKEPYLDLLYKLEKSDDFYRESKEVRFWFYEQFSKYIKLKECNICLDTY